MASSYSSSPLRNLNEFDDDESVELDFDVGSKATEDDLTDDASETEKENNKEQFTEIKEQMYQDKLAQLKKQLGQLKDGTLPEYLKRLRKLENQFNERKRICEVWYKYEMDEAEKTYKNEQAYAVKEFEDKKVDLKDSLLMELEDKQRQTEIERHNMDLTSDSMEMKPVTTRKLRRRPNDPLPLPEKRRKPSPDIHRMFQSLLRRGPLNFYLDDDAIIEDLNIINKVAGKPMMRAMTNSTLSAGNKAYSSALAQGCDILYEARIDDGRLFFDKKWFHRGQAVIVDSRESGRMSASITAIGTHEIWLRKTTDTSKLRIYLSQLQKGRYSLRKRS